MPVSMLYVTTGTKAEATQLAEKVVSERLAACGNVINPVSSIYAWNGKMCQEDEVILILKTRTALVSKLTDRIRELHSYELPCIVAYETIGGNPEYFRWVESQTDLDDLRLV